MSDIQYGSATNPSNDTVYKPGDRATGGLGRPSATSSSNLNPASTSATSGSRLNPVSINSTTGTLVSGNRPLQRPRPNSIIGMTEVSHSTPDASQEQLAREIMNQTTLTISKLAFPGNENGVKLEESKCLIGTDVAAQFARDRYLEKIYDFTEYGEAIYEAFRESS